MGQINKNIRECQLEAKLTQDPVEEKRTMLERRRKLNRRIVIFAGIYLLGLTAASFLLLLINTYLVYPYMRTGVGVSISSLPEEYRNIIDLRFKAFDVQYAVSQLTSTFATLGGLVIVCADLNTKPAVSVAAKGKFLGVLAVGMALAVIPFGLLDGVYGLNANYFIAPVGDFIVVGVYTIIDIAVTIWRKRQGRLLDCRND